MTSVADVCARAPVETVQKAAAIAIMDFLKTDLHIWLVSFPFVKLRDAVRITLPSFLYVVFERTSIKKTFFMFILQTFMFANLTSKAFAYTSAL